MKTVFQLGAALALCVFACACHGQAVKWADAETVMKRASQKPVYVQVIKSAMTYPDGIFDQLQKALATDKDCATAAQGFEMATINAWSNSVFGGGDGINHEIADKWGTPGTGTLYAPGAKRALWQEDMGGSPEETAKKFKGASEAYTKWKQGIEDIEQKMKADKAAKADPAVWEELGQAWAKGYMAKDARKKFEEAIKLLKKAGGEAERIEALAWRACEVEYESAEYALAAASLPKFIKEHKEGAHAKMARVLLAKATGKNGDVEGAKKQLKEILADKEAAESHKDAQDALDEFNKPPPKR